MSALDVVRGGKHSGSTYGAVADTDRGYCHWITNATALPRSLRPFRTYLQRTHGGVLCFGKHKNSFYSEIYKDFPECPAIVMRLERLSYAAGSYAAYMRRAKGVR